MTLGPSSQRIRPPRCEEEWFQQPYSFHPAFPVVMADGSVRFIIDHYAFQWGRPDPSHAVVNDEPYCWSGPNPQATTPTMDLPDSPLTASLLEALTAVIGDTPLVVDANNNPDESNR